MLLPNREPVPRRGAVAAPSRSGEGGLDRGHRNRDTGRRGTGMGSSVVAMHHSTGSRGTGRWTGAVVGGGIERHSRSTRGMSSRGTGSRGKGMGSRSKGMGRGWKRWGMGLLWVGEALNGTDALLGVHDRR